MKCAAEDLRTAWRKLAQKLLLAKYSSSVLSGSILLCVPRLQNAFNWRGRLQVGYERILFHTAKAETAKPAMMCTQKCGRGHKWRNYDACSFDEFLLSLSGSTTPDRASTNSSNPAKRGVPDRRRNTFPAEHMVILLPLCKECALPRKCTAALPYLTSPLISTHGSKTSEVAFIDSSGSKENTSDRSSEGSAVNSSSTSLPVPTGFEHPSTPVVSASPVNETSSQLLGCPCGLCVASFLAFILLRIALSILQPREDQCGVLFCQALDLLDNPQHRVNPFVILLRRLLHGKVPLPWSRVDTCFVSEKGDSIRKGTLRIQMAFDGLHATKTGCLSEYKKEFHALSRLAYKLLEGSDEMQRSQNLTGTHSGSPPDLIRYLAELPFALPTPPKLVLCLQPSRSLPYNQSNAGPRGGHQEGVVPPTTLQESADVNSYSLFVSLMLRALNTAVAANKQSNPPEFARGVVVEAIQCCSCCCCSSPRPDAIDTLPVGESIASLCCLEENDWLWTLRGRFTRVILLHRSNSSDRSTLEPEKYNCALSEDILCVDITKSNAERF